MENNYVDQFRYTQHMIIDYKGEFSDDTIVFIVSRCPSLLSIEFHWPYIDENYISDFSYITDYSLQSIGNYYILITAEK